MPVLALQCEEGRGPGEFGAVLDVVDADHVAEPRRGREGAVGLLYNDRRPVVS
jgi:hypothetical protein